MGLSRFICRDDQERDWLLDMNRRLRPQVLRANVVLGLFLVAGIPWFAPLSIVPVCVAGAVFALGMELAHRRQRMQPLVFCWFMAQTLLALAIGLNSGEHNAGVTLLMFPVIGACGGFPTRLVTVCVGYTAALMVALGLGVDGSVVTSNPPLLLIPLAMLFASAIISSAVRRSSFEHQAAAVVDQLTGMLNRSALATRTRELEHQSTLTGQPVGVIVLDVDHFKEINDRHGHQQGDEVLQDLAYRLRKELRAFDLAYRLGGEEFVVLMPGATAPDATAVARQLHGTVRAQPLAGVAVTISVGVATSRPGAGFDFDEVFFSADGALYEAKRTGRDRVCTASAIPATSADLAATAA